MKALLLLAVSAALAAQTPIEAKTILVIGDSISAGYGIQRNQGWVALLEARVGALQPPYKVVNASISGDTTGGGARTIAAHTGNSLSRTSSSSNSAATTRCAVIRSNASKSNLDAMATLAKDAGASVLVLGMEIPPNYGARYTQAFHAIYADVAKRTGATLVPFLLDGVATDDALMQADGIHPTAAAQDRLLETSGRR